MPTKTILHLGEPTHPTISDPMSLKEVTSQAESLMTSLVVKG